MTDVEIEYCVPCGLYDNAAEVQEHLLEEFGERLDSVTLTTGDSGVFKIWVDGDLVFDSDTDEEFDIEAVADEVRGRVPAEA